MIFIARSRTTPGSLDLIIRKRGRVNTLSGDFAAIIDGFGLYHSGAGLGISGVDLL